MWYCFGCLSQSGVSWGELCCERYTVLYHILPWLVWSCLSSNWCIVNVSSFGSISVHTHTRLTAHCPGLPRLASTRKVKPIWILLKQETVSGIDISWAICKQSAPRSRQITMPAPHQSVFYRPDALPAAQPTASMHWRQMHCMCTVWQHICTISVYSLPSCHESARIYGPVGASGRNALLIRFIFTSVL